MRSEIYLGEVQILGLGFKYLLIWEKDSYLKKKIL